MIKSLCAVVFAIATFSGCYAHSMRDAPRPPEAVQKQADGWNEYISQLYSICNYMILLLEKKKYLADI